MVIQLTFTLILFGVILETTFGSLYDPHLFPSLGPFFEGWYLRITDFDKKQSLGLLFGSVLPEKGNSSVDPLVVASVLLRNCSDTEQDECQLFAVNGKFREQELKVTVKGHAVLEDPDVKTPPNFKWQVSHNDTGGYFEQVNGSTNFNFRLGDMTLRGEASDPHYWREDGTGPEGWLVYLPLPLHWFVFSLRSKVVHYELQNITSGVVVRGRRGTVHLEKNWGKSFPRRWIWSQGVSSTDNSSFALSGGTVDFYGLSVNAYLVGYRNPSAGISLDFQPVNSFVSAEIRGCDGKVGMSINSLMYRVEIKLSAPLKTLSGCLLAPEVSGFRGACVESYDATAEISVFKRKLIFFPAELIQKQVFHGAALEFGGTYVCNNTCLST